MPDALSAASLGSPKAKDMRLPCPACPFSATRLTNWNEHIRVERAREIADEDVFKPHHGLSPIGAAGLTTTVADFFGAIHNSYRTLRRREQQSRLALAPFEDGYPGVTLQHAVVATITYFRARYDILPAAVTNKASVLEFLSDLVGKNPIFVSLPLAFRSGTLSGIEGLGHVLRRDLRVLEDLLEEEWKAEFARSSPVLAYTGTPITLDDNPNIDCSTLLSALREHEPPYDHFDHTPVTLEARLFTSAVLTPFSSPAEGFEIVRPGARIVAPGRDEAGTSFSYRVAPAGGIVLPSFSGVWTTFESVCVCGETMWIWTEGTSHNLNAFFLRWHQKATVDSLSNFLTDFNNLKIAIQRPGEYFLIPAGSIYTAISLSNTLSYGAQTIDVEGEAVSGATFGPFEMVEKIGLLGAMRNQWEKVQRRVNAGRQASEEEQLAMKVAYFRILVEGLDVWETQGLRLEEVEAFDECGRQELGDDFWEMLRGGSEGSME